MMMKKRLVWLLLLTAALLLAGLCGSQAEGAQITGKVWVEKDADGLLASNENGLAYAEITLEQRLSDGSIIQLAYDETARDGLYAFSVAQSGEYRLQIKLIKDYQFAMHGLDSAALPAQDNISYTPFFTVSDGELIQKNIGSTRSTSYISIYAFEDENANGGRMQTEAKIRGVLAELLYEYEGETYVVASVTTDRNGEASIRDLSAGTYRLRVTLPENYMIGPIGQKVSAFYNCVLASESQVGYTAPFTVAPKGSQGLAVGAVRTGSLTGSLWMDENEDSVWNGTESGLPSVRMTLYSQALGLARETVTDDNGEFSFIHIQPGEYELTLSLPQDMIFTRRGQSMLSEIANQHTIRVTIQPESTVALNPIGVMDATSLSLYFYEDTVSVNGRPDENEQPLSGVSVTLFQEGKQVAQGISAQDGRIHFPFLRQGSVTVEAALPQNMLFTRSETGIFHLTQAQSKAQTILNIDADTEETLFSAGASSPASLSGILFEDPDNRGLYSDAFARLSGFTVQAVHPDGQLAAQSLTDSQGQYSLAPLMPGEYTVRFLLADPYVASPFDNSQPMNNAISLQTPEYGETETVFLTPGENKTSLNGSVFRAGTVDGYVLQHFNEEEISAGAQGIPGVTVTLMDESGEPFSQFTYGVTDENGYFYIKGVLPGSFYLHYSLPQGTAFTQPLTNDPQFESASFVTGSGSEIHMPSLGAIETSALSGRVSHATAQGSVATPALITLDSHEYGYTYETFTQDDGSYRLADLRPGVYTLRISLMDEQGLIFTDGEHSLVSPLADNFISQEITMELGKDWDNANIYTALPASVQGLIYYDENTSAALDENERGAEYRAFSLWRKDQKIIDLTTDANGAFTADQLVPGEYTLRMTLGDAEILINQPRPAGNEWHYAFTLQDGAVNQVVQIPMLRYASAAGQIWNLDGSLKGVQNIPVTLLNAQGQAISTVLSDEDGHFIFTELIPGIYALNATLPTGHVFARQMDLTTRTSNIYTLLDGSCQTAAFQLPMGVNLTGLTIGMGAMGAIGDYAWLDDNGNGMQDMGESPMPGIRIELYQYGQLVATATTNEYGFYRITNLYPGEYQMKVTMHKELKTTRHQQEFPLVASILPQSNNTTVTADGIIVPSGGETLHYDLGFQLRKKNTYPDAMKLIPTKDWRPYSER